MARRRPLTADPLVRSRVRSGVRAGKTAAAIAADILASFPRATEGQTRRVIEQEVRRQDAVDRLMRKDFRTRSNLHAIVGCGKGERVRARITVTWTDPQTGHTRTYGSTVPMKSTGVLSSILNEAIDTVVQDAKGRGYQPPRITSQMTEGRNSYRIEYLDCV